mmetsp:Transcript_60321/g.188953  ORF Transcript_60321/g.188953 Transcript_60321/m.188953 type:complete len:270 (+) Transcript_60321:175-984(+)
MLSGSTQRLHPCLPACLHLPSWTHVAMATVHPVGAALRAPIPGAGAAPAGAVQDGSARGLRQPHLQRHDVRRGQLRRLRLPRLGHPVQAQEAQRLPRLGHPVQAQEAQLLRCRPQRRGGRRQDRGRVHVRRRRRLSGTVAESRSATAHPRRWGLDWKRHRHQADERERHGLELGVAARGGACGGRLRRRRRRLVHGGCGLLLRRPAQRLPAEQARVPVLPSPATLPGLARADPRNRSAVHALALQRHAGRLHGADRAHRARACRECGSS